MTAVAMVGANNVAVGGVSGGFISSMRFMSGCESAEANDDCESLRK